MSQVLKPLMIKSVKSIFRNAVTQVDKALLQKVLLLNNSFSLLNFQTKALPALPLKPY